MLKSENKIIKFSQCQKFKTPYGRLIHFYKKTLDFFQKNRQKRSFDLLFKTFSETFKCFFEENDHFTIQ